MGQQRRHTRHPPVRREDRQEQLCLWNALHWPAISPSRRLPERGAATGRSQAPHLERRVAVQLKHAKVDVVAAQRPRQDGQAVPNALVLLQNMAGDGVVEKGSVVDE